MYEYCRLPTLRMLCTSRNLVLVVVPVHTDRKQRVQQYLVLVRELKLVLYSTRYWYCWKRFGRQWTVNRAALVMVYYQVPAAYYDNSCTMKLTQVRVILVWVKRRFWFGHSTERYLACPMDDYTVFVYQGNTIIRSCRHYWFCRTRTFYCHFINIFWPLLVEIHLKSNKNNK